MAAEFASDTRVGTPPERGDSATIELADVQIEFSSTDRELLAMVRRAASYCAPRQRPRALERHVRANLVLSDQASWERHGPDPIRASSPRDAEALDAVLRAALCDALAPDGALLHAAGVIVRDRALLFLAPSGGGKSTISRLVGDRFQLLSDETVCVRPSEDGSGYLAYSTCFWSTAGPKQNPSRGFPLAGLCFLDKGPLRCAPLARRTALRELMAQYHLRVSPGAGTETLDFGLRLLDEVPAYRLRFPIDAELDLLLDALVLGGIASSPPSGLAEADRVG